jgi:hypothetical protein
MQVQVHTGTLRRKLTVMKNVSTVKLLLIVAACIVVALIVF